MRTFESIYDAKDWLLANTAGPASVLYRSNEHIYLDRPMVVTAWDPYYPEVIGFVPRKSAGLDSHWMN